MLFRSLYPLKASVSHGTNRRYDRYVVHLVLLHIAGIARHGRGNSPRDLPAYMQRGSAKHPARAQLRTLLNDEDMGLLVLDLPPCQSCRTLRLNESQRYCHNCGELLVVASQFDQCMKLQISKLPGISSALIKRLHEETKLRTVGDVYFSQSPGADLQRARYIGPKRADGIISAVFRAVEEFLS